MELHDRSFAELTARELYEIVRLRVDVFVVEQGCPYAELDGRDHEPDARHIWVADEHGPVSYLRLLPELDDATTIGRVVTRADQRGNRRSEPLVEHALATSAGPHLINAQSRLQGWYERLGFSLAGEEFMEDGIAHVPMRRG